MHAALSRSHLASAGRLGSGPALGPQKPRRPRPASRFHDRRSRHGRRLRRLLCRRPDPACRRARPLRRSPARIHRPAQERPAPDRPWTAWTAASRHSHLRLHEEPPAGLKPDLVLLCVKSGCHGRGSDGPGPDAASRARTVISLQNGIANAATGTRRRAAAALACGHGALQHRRDRPPATTTVAPAARWPPKARPTDLALAAWQTALARVGMKAGPACRPGTRCNGASCC